MLTLKSALYCHIYDPKYSALPEYKRHLLLEKLFGVRKSE